jgi:hypothetical protein
MHLPKSENVDFCWIAGIQNKQGKNVFSQVRKGSFCRIGGIQNMQGKNAFT